MSVVDDPIAAASAVADREWRLAVGGRARVGATYTVECPATEQPLAEAPDATIDDVDEAVRSAADAATAWRAVQPRERAGRLRELATAIRAHTDELATLDALDSGNPVTAMRTDVGWGADVLELFADYATHLGGETIPASAENLHFTRRAPFGVVARIVPFNHPAMFAAAKIAAPLLAGNSVVLKPSEITPLSALRIAEIATGILPEGTLSVLTSSGPAPSQALVRHPLVRRIGFIGSERVGRIIQRDAAESGVKDISLELGGKNALIVCPDADLEAAADGIVGGMNFAWSAGQSCGSTSRVLLHAAIADEVLALVRERVAAIRIGSPLDPGTQMGPLASRAQYEKARGYIDVASAEGATLLHGGGRPEGHDRGYYVEPTIFTGVEPDMRIAREEVFGPVMSVLSFTDLDEAVRIANGVDYGLTASIWTRDVSTALDLAERVEAGYVWVNGSSRHFWGVPFGGTKSSGVGREESVEELLSYTELKAVNVVV
ncbi:aldehyde dehydrogenase family protein [Prauserella cavernicola]|uniref:Aldehyde dehydrogenase family protein n=1 Tax=Prauserella cavernicola TaxID=2800127 RepID=A0A934QW17_9PSEU|nr:aldehyde dehydrogenase family protein [Prauserella cavernicola]MBK1787581.1 aldehyde dehydrogenase family protein [Prauserella cavernicola]